MDYRDIAAELGFSPTNLSHYKAMAVRRLRELLKVGRREHLSLFPAHRPVLAYTESDEDLAA